jgi:hypothetical protein
MGSHNVSTASDVRSGAALNANRSAPRGVPIANLVIESFVPIVADADALIDAATSTELPNATTTTYSFPVTTAASPQDGANTTGILDVPRNITAAASHGSSVVAMTIVVSGYDVHGAPMKETLSIAATGTSQTATGGKAFKRVTSIAITSAGNATTNTLDIGFGAVLGLTYRPKIGGFIRGRLNEDSADAGTYTAPIRTTSTATTADVRGMYAYAGTANGTNRFTVLYVADNGPTDADAYGIAQYNG